MRFLLVAAPFSPFLCAVLLNRLSERRVEKWENALICDRERANAALRRFGGAR